MVNLTDINKLADWLKTKSVLVSREASSGGQSFLRRNQAILQATNGSVYLDIFLQHNELNFFPAETANIQNRLISVFGGHAIAPRILPISSQGGTSSSRIFNSQTNIPNTASRIGGTPAMSILESTFAPAASASAENTHDSRQASLQGLLSLARSGLVLSTATGNLQHDGQNIAHAAFAQSGTMSSANFDTRLGHSISNYSGSNAAQTSGRTCEVICIDSDDNEEEAASCSVTENSAL